MTLLCREAWNTDLVLTCILLQFVYPDYSSVQIFLLNENGTIDTFMPKKNDLLNKKMGKRRVEDVR